MPYSENNMYAKPLLSVSVAYALKLLIYQTVAYV